MAMGDQMRSAPEMMKALENFHIQAGLKLCVVMIIVHHNVHFLQYIFPNKLRPTLKFEKYYPIEHKFVPACSSGRKTHFFKF